MALLVLTRKKREGIFIADHVITINGDNIIIKIIEIQGDRVKIGIEAPDKYHIAREELITPIDKKEITREELITPIDKKEQP